MQQVPAEPGFQRSQAQGSGSSQSLKSGGDPWQNTRVSSGKPKKRERSEPACDPVKQQRIDKGQRRADEKDGAWIPGVSSLVGKDGGVCSVASVDRLVCVMQYEWNDGVQRPVDLIVSRTMLAKVVAATLELERLFRFLKLGGLIILDRWLQEAHRSRPLSNGDTVEDGEKAVEDLLLALLGALERLPVDLVALKTCSVGKSVNNLRSHTHLDIQRRARKLVDTWKKRVESEMQQSGEVRLSVDPGLCLQQLDVGMSALNTQEESYMEHPLPVEYSCLGRGKFVSVASLCSSPESQGKASSMIIPFSPVSACSVDTSNKALPMADVSKPLKVTLKQAPDSTLHPLNGYTQSSEDGRSKSGIDITQNNVSIPGPCKQMRSVKSNGANRHGKSTNVINSNTSVATAVSASVPVVKDHTENGSGYDSRQPVSVPIGAEVCTLPCCSSSQKNSDNSLVYDARSRSTVNSTSSCVADHQGKIKFLMKYSQPPIGPEPAKAGIQLLASIAASESSMIGMKSPDSPSDKSVSMRRAATLPTGNPNPAEVVMKCCNQPSVGISQDREHYDRNSSTVSSPSETSTHVDIHMCESRRVPAVYVNAPSPVDTTSETSLPRPVVGKDLGRNSGACTGGSHKDGKAQVACEKSKRFCSQSAVIAEAVGESIVVDRAESKSSVILTPEIVMGNRHGSKELSPLRYGEIDSLEFVGQIAVEVEQEVVNCQGGFSKTETFDRSSLGDAKVGSRSTCSSVMVDSKQDPSTIVSPSSDTALPPAMYVGAKVSPLGDADVVTLEQMALGSDAIPCTRGRVEPERLVFDLNEMLWSEDGPMQTCTTSGRCSNWLGPIQDCPLPASVSKPAFPIVPMAPIAVAAAAKGSFTLSAVSCRPLGGELGWRGSAATSAFRPTQPRHNLNVPEQSHHVKTFLDFDLNITADPSPVDDGKLGIDMEKSSFLVAKVAAKPGMSIERASLNISKKGCEPHRAAWDLNQVDEGAAESHSRQDFDLNSGPDNDDVALSGKHICMWESSIPATTSTGIANRLPPYSLSPVTPIIIPAFAMPNSDIPYPGGTASPWVNSGSQDGLLQYNIFMQNQSGFPASGMACPPLPTLAAGPYGGFGFSSASMQGFSAPFMDTLRMPTSAAQFASNEPQMPSQSKPPYIMSVLADMTHQQGHGGFWSRPNLDLNAGPENVDANYTKDDRRHMFVMNEQTRARQHQVMDLAALLQRREQEGCVGMSGSMQGALSKHPTWP